MAALAAAGAGDEAQVAAKLREACALLPELRSEPVLVLGRVLAALGGAGDSSPAIATVARLWPGVDETAAALRAYAALSSLASGHPRRAAAAARGSRSAPPPSSDATRRRPGSTSGRRSTAGSTRVRSLLSWLRSPPPGRPGALRRIGWVETRYRPENVEQRWQETWEAEGLYAAEPDESRESFVVAHPPPNVTGELHMGHALQLSLADAIVRLKRMQGLNTLFQPGYDHAGISTQNAVEKHLATEGTSRQKIGREAFEARVWDWLHQYGRTIMTQFRRLGASMDYRRERFTMDDDYVRAVMRFFVHLYEKGWIYQDNRIINWCPFHQTSLSDLELVHVEADDALTHVRYSLVDGDGGIVIATARPATILADVAVAVHPDDERYRELVGREVVVPYVESRVPVIADDRVERDFGTGALKVTPGHDPLDFEIGRAHGLPEPMVIGPDGRMNEAAGDLAGLTQEEAEERILAWLRERDQLEKRESYRHSVALCERCESRIEPLISLQWWCRMDELREPALAVLRDGRVRYHPESQHRFAIDSLENAPDWNISRQLWWGHQLPVWHCPDGHVTVAETSRGLRRVRLGGASPGRGRARHLVLLGALAVRDAGVARRHARPSLLLPGRSEHDGARDHPALGESHDLLRPRARRRGALPQRDHPLDRARTRRAADVEEPRHRNRPARRDREARDGRDALRAHEDDLDPGRPLLVRRRRRGLEARQQALERSSPSAERRRRGEVSARPRFVEERWILARIDQVRAEVEEALAGYQFYVAANALYHLVFDDFCDWYAEAIKPRLYARDPDTVATRSSRSNGC